jgi:D-aspartate ligase
LTSQAGLPTAAVIGVGWTTGLDAIRALGRLGAPVLAIDPRPSAHGFRSRYAIPTLCPPVEQEEELIDFLVRLGDGFNTPAPIFPTSDEYLNTLAKHRDQLGNRYRYPFPTWDVLEPIQGKRHQVETAIAAGVPVPQTSDEPTEKYGFPVLVKPSSPQGFRARFGVQAFRCRTPAELAEAYDKCLPFDPLVQEFIPGGDDELYTFGGVVSEDGRPLAKFSGRKLRQTPPVVGTCRIGESVWVDDVVDQGLALLRALRFQGVAQVEFKRDHRDGRYKLIEVNPRLWQWHGLTGHVGVDVTQISYLHLLGADLEETTMQHVRKRWVTTFRGDTRPMLVRPPYVDAFLALDDPKPAAVQVYRLTRNAIRGLAGKDPAAADPG